MLGCMGNWNISIEGLGSHHNGADAVVKELNEYDADKLAKKFVKELKHHGHIVDKASFTHGGAESLLPEDEASIHPIPPGTAVDVRSKMLPGGEDRLAEIDAEKARMLAAGATEREVFDAMRKMHAEKPAIEMTITPRAKGGADE